MINKNEEHSSRSVCSIIQRDKNNFDLLRLIAAIAVIFGHSYAISPQPPHKDFILNLLFFDYSGSLAVNFFFFLSGLLVMDSLIRRPKPLQFLVRRASRIFPGLVLCLFVTVFIIGPLFTKLSIFDYFTQKETWSYLFKNISLGELQWKLPGVFSDSQFGLNGSLWTLPYELKCYLYLTLFCGLGLFTNRFIANSLYLAIISIALFMPNFLLQFGFPQTPKTHILAAYFSVGMLCALNKEKISLNGFAVLVMWGFYLLVPTAARHNFLFYSIFFYTSLYIASLPFVIKYLKLPCDISYGVYIYGFMIQQSIHAVFPTMGIYGNQLICILIACLAGLASWFLIEKPAISLGAKITASDWAQLRSLKWLRRDVQHV